MRQLRLLDKPKPATRKRGTGAPVIDKKQALIFQLKALKLPPWQTEYRFHATRLWRFDIAFPELKLAIEVEGGLYVQGRHSRGAGAEADMDKYGEAFALGWSVLRVSPRKVKSGAAVMWVERAIRDRGSA